MKERSYKIGEQTTIIFNGETEIRFRKGVWNIEEACLDISVYDPLLQDAYIAMLSDLADNKQISEEDLFSKYHVPVESIEDILSLLDELSSFHYLINNESDYLKKLIQSLIGGTSVMLSQGAQQFQKRVLLVTDCIPLEKQLCELAESMQMTLSVMSTDKFNKIAAADLTSKNGNPPCSEHAGRTFPLRYDNQGLRNRLL